MKSAKKIVIIILVLVIATIYSYGIWPRAIYDTSIGSGNYETTNTLTDGVIVEQQFRCGDDGFSGLTIKMTKQGHDTIGNYQWDIVDVQSGKTVGSGMIDEKSTENADFESSNVQKQGIIELSFPRIENSKGKEYILKIEPQNVNDNQAVALFITEKAEEEGLLLTVAGQETEKASVVKLEYCRFNIETFVVFLAIVAYLFAFVKFMYKLFR